MNTHNTTSKGNDAAKTAADYQKAVVQNQNAAPNENAPAFTKGQSVPTATKPTQVPTQLHAAKGNDEVMSLPPQSDSAPTAKAATPVKPVPKETAQEAVHQVMPRTEARKLASKMNPKSPLEKAPS